MKCPYSNCRKDYNDNDWPRALETWINPRNFGGSIADREFYNRPFLIIRKCRFCNQLFYEVYIGHENFDKEEYFKELEPTLELLATYPVSKAKFEAKNVPQKVEDAFHEAERCRSVGSLTGSGSCLRKAIYVLCDEKGAEGRDYREKIANLPVKDTYKELLKQIKWLGDNTTKPGEEKYTLDMVDVAFEILPIIIDDMYIKDEKTDQASKLLAKAKSANTKSDTKSETDIR